MIVVRMYYLVPDLCRTQVAFDANAGTMKSLARRARAAGCSTFCFVIELGGLTALSLWPDRASFDRFLEVNAKLLNAVERLIGAPHDSRIDVSPVLASHGEVMAS